MWWEAQWSALTHSIEVMKKITMTKQNCWTYDFNLKLVTEQNVLQQLKTKPTNESSLTYMKRKMKV